MPTPGSPTPDPRTPAGRESGLDQGRGVAIAALLHRLNGGLNNAALAFELALSSGDDDGDNSAQVLKRGLAGVEQASRAGTLLALMLDPTAAVPASTRGPYAEDVAEILRAHARRLGCEAEADLNVVSLAESDPTPAAPVEALLDALLTGLAALESRRRTASEVQPAT